MSLNLFPMTLVLLTMCCMFNVMAQITETKIIASDLGSRDGFGYSVSLFGDNALVGARRFRTIHTEAPRSQMSDDALVNGIDGEDAGSAYIFHFDGSNWVEQIKLTSSDGEVGDYFGSSVSLSGDHALVGAYGEGPGAGSAYIFHFDGTTWVEQDKINANDRTAGDAFGFSVSLSGDHALVGALYDGAGSAYIFHFDGSNWVEQTKLTASDGAVGDYFGRSVSLSGDYALVGALDGAGSAYIFHFDGSNWVEQTKLTASDGEDDDSFGISVSLSGDYALVGASSDDDGSSPNAGSAYIFHFDGSNWVEQAKLIASDVTASDYFGSSVSLSGDYALVGAQNGNGIEEGAGSAYIFHFDGSNWVEQTKLTASDGEDDDDFGNSVSLSGESAIVGADGNRNAGSAYVYTGFSPPPAPLAQFGVFYGSTGSAEPSNPGALITIDPLTGEGSLVGPTGIIGDAGPSVPALAIKSTGEMYAVSASTNSGLYTVNATTGVGTFLASTGLSLPNAMAFDDNDQLYIADGSNNLYTLDQTTGLPTLIGPLGFSVRGIAFDPTDGTMYGASGIDGIYTIDPMTATSTLVGNTGLGGATLDIHFDQDGNLFGTKIGSNYISIDKVTGIGTMVGLVGFAAVIGLSTRLDYVQSMSCDDIFFFNAKCNMNGAAQAMVKMSRDFSGETVTFDLDGEAFVATVNSNGTNSIAKMTVPHAGMGAHTVTLEVPGGCFSPVTFNCQVDATPDPEWDALWAEHEFMESASELKTVPAETRLLGNYPNPFNPSTTFRYALSAPGLVSLRVYNMLGQLVGSIVDEHQVEGYYQAIWDGRNDAGASVSSGIYIYRLTAGVIVETRRMTLVK